MSATQTVVQENSSLQAGQLEHRQRMQPEVMHEGSNKEASNVGFTQGSGQSDWKRTTRSDKFPTGGFGQFTTKPPVYSTKMFPRGPRGYVTTIREGSYSKTESDSSSVFSAIPRRHKWQKPVSRGSYESSRLCRVHELDMMDPCIRNIPRAGVLFYTFIDDELYICFGRDQGSSDLTDFGGGRKQSEDPVKCSIREGNEESRFAFSEIKPDQVQEFYCLYSSNMLIVFIPVAAPDGMDIREITKENFSSKQFLNRRQSQARCYNEVSDLVWLGETSIENLFSARPSFQMFAKVRRFIYSCNEFSKSSVQMKNILLSIVKEAEQAAIADVAETPRTQSYSLFPSREVRVAFQNNEWIENSVFHYSRAPGANNSLYDNVPSAGQSCRSVYGSSFRYRSCSPGVIKVDNYAVGAGNH